MTPQDFETLTGQNVVTMLAEIIGLEGRPTLTPEETFKWLGLGRTAGYEALRRERSRAFVLADGSCVLSPPFCCGYSTWPLEMQKRRPL